MKKIWMYCRLSARYCDSIQMIFLHLLNKLPYFLYCYWRIRPFTAAARTKRTILVACIQQCKICTFSVKNTPFLPSLLLTIIPQYQNPTLILLPFQLSQHGSTYEAGISICFIFTLTLTYHCHFINSYLKQQSEYLKHPRENTLRARYSPYRI